MVNAHVTGGKRNAKAVFLFVFEFVVDQDRIFQWRAGTLLIVVVEALAVDDEKLLNRNAGALEQADLLGLLVFDGGFAAQSVEIVFAEGFLLELRSGLCGGHGSI